MKTGFYNTDSLSEEQQESLVEDAILLSWKTEVQSKYSKRNKWRGDEPSMSIKEAMGICSSLKVVDRTIQHPEMEDTNQGEISLISISWQGEGWLLLYCFLSLPNLKKLTTKYNLKME